MRFLRSKSGVVAILLVGVLALFLVRPGAQRLRTRIVASIGLALGRQVDIDSVQVHVLPQPGFDFENFVVHDDAAFGAEPVLRAQEVSATIRLTSLLRGRLEISRLNLTEPSLNLVRNSEGHWNLENLLERAARVPIAPTGKGKAEARPGFPYIEADRGRINFKFGPEKKPYALTNADFALWQESENQWGMRLKAQPVRTDFNLGDTGELSVNGSWQRAESLRQTPVNFSLQWNRAQLGQVSQLLQGADKGWRGGAQLAATLRGSPEDLAVKAAVTIQDFRRFDVLSSGSLQLAAQCAGHYSTRNRTLSEIACTAPIGKGAINLEGNAEFQPMPAYQLRLTAEDVAMAWIAVLAQHAKKNLPDDLVADGVLRADFSVHRSAEQKQASWDGSGDVVDLRVKSDTVKTQLAVDSIPFKVSRDGDQSRRSLRRIPASSLGPSERIEIGPFDLALGRPAPVAVQGWISHTGYSFSVQGDSDVQRILQLARVVGLPASQPAASGLAKLSLRVEGSWKGFAPSLVTGSAQLKAVRAELPGFNSPLEIAGANLLLNPEGMTVNSLAASLAESKWTGTLDMPRHCSLSTNCEVRFDLHVDQVATDQWAQLVNPNLRKRPWYRWLAPGTQSRISWLNGLRASGRIAANRLAIHSLIATKATAKVDLQDGKLRASELRAEVLAGKHFGEWQVDFTSKPPRYTGSGTFENVALHQLSELMHDGWVTGTAGGSYRVTASGYTVAELTASADGNLKFEAREGAFPHLVLTGAGAPLQAQRFAGRLTLRDGKFEIQEGKLEVPGGIYQVSGTASLGRKLDIRLHGAAHGFNVGGTLSEPRVTVATPPETQAALKP